MNIICECKLANTFQTDNFKYFVQQKRVETYNAPISTDNRTYIDKPPTIPILRTHVQIWSVHIISHISECCHVNFLNSFICLCV